MARSAQVLLIPRNIQIGEGLNVVVQTFSGGVGGLIIDKPSSNTTDQSGIAFSVDHNLKYGIGMDASNSDLALVYDLSIPGDTARCSAGGKWIFGTGIGSPSAEAAVFTIDGTTGNQALHALSTKNSNNGEYGIVVNNASSGTGAASLLSVTNNGGTAEARVEVYSTGHSSKANQAWFFASGASTPIVLGTSGTERWRIHQTSGKLLGALGVSLGLTEGSNATMGVVTLSGGTGTASVSTSAFTSGTRVFLAHQNASGTIGTARITVSSAGNFTISTGTADTSHVAWFIMQSS